jgi:hypothetical protein
LGSSSVQVSSWPLDTGSGLPQLLAGPQGSGLQGGPSAAWLVDGLSALRDSQVAACGLQTPSLCYLGLSQSCNR